MFSIKPIIVLSCIASFSFNLHAHAPRPHPHHQKPSEEIPEVTYKVEDSTAEVQVTPSGETFMPISNERHAQHQAAGHGYYPIISGLVPSLFTPPAMDNVQDYIIKKDEMVVINPAENEYIHIMEGKRHGFENLTVAITNTHTGNGAPLHSHVGEEAHLLLKGKMLYHLDGEEVVVEAPYIVNIPSMVPHAFINIDDEPAELIGIFPSNEWEYDILDGPVFTEGVDELTEENAAEQEKWKNWHKPSHAKKRLDYYKKHHTHGGEAHHH